MRRLDEDEGEHPAAEEEQHHALAEAERGAPLQLWLALEPAHHQAKAARGDVRLERAPVDRGLGSGRRGFAQAFCARRARPVGAWPVARLAAWSRVVVGPWGGGPRRAAARGQ